MPGVFNEMRAPTEFVSRLGVVGSKHESSVPSAVDCSTLVHKYAPEAQAAEYSNLGEIWCKSVFNA